MTLLTQTHKIIDQDWFGGQVMSVVGECHCSADKKWDDDKNVCFFNFDYLQGAATLLLGCAPLVLGLLANLHSL